MDDRIFRMYDIRGKVGSELMIDQIYQFGRALAYFFLQRKPNMTRVALGMDGRLHSEQIKQELSQALRDSGLDVIFIGVCPTPVLYFTTATTDVDAGLMITASHNPKEYNGIKIVLDKQPIWGDDIQNIKRLFNERKEYAAQRHGVESTCDMIDRYISWMQNHFSSLCGSEISVIIDCGNGAAGTVLPILLQKMNLKKTSLLYEEVDGSYPHHEADPVSEKNMADVKRILQTSDYTFGLGLDGDCDRMAPMTKSGYLVPGDELLAVFSKPILAQFPGATVVFDIKSSSGLIEVLQKWGAMPLMAPSGHSIIKTEMQKHKAVLAGELSCHFFFNDRYFGYDDGIYAMLRLFEIVQQTGKTLDELLCIVPHRYNSPEIRISCREDEKYIIIKGAATWFAQQQQAEIVTIDGIRVTMPYGWGILRASNTQPVLCLRFESDSPAGLDKIKQDFSAALQHYFDKKWLQNQLNM